MVERLDISRVAVSIVVLAAGASSRMGSEGGHKLLSTFGGETLVRHSVLAATRSSARDVVVVTGHRSAEIEAALHGVDVRVVRNAQYRLGIAGSISRGVEAARRTKPDGIMIMLADMPALTVTDLDALITAFVRSKATSIVRAAASGEPGSPVIFPASLYEKLRWITGDVGARAVAEDGSVSVIGVEIGDAARLDVDTPEQVIAAGGALER